MVFTVYEILFILEKFRAKISLTPDPPQEVVKLVYTNIPTSDSSCKSITTSAMPFGDGLIDSHN